MLSKVIAKNFLSWSNLEFNISKGIVLIDGWNEDDQRSEGSGKSAVLNAISWCIYGKLPKDVNIDDVIKDGESSCVVALEFDNGDLIVRSRKPNDLHILKSGATIKGKDLRETQILVEEYVGCSFETFCQSVYFAQNYDRKFLLSNQEEKGKILSSIQNLQVFDKARKEVVDLLKSENDTIVKLKNKIQVEDSNLNNLGSQRSLVQSFIADKIKKHAQQELMITQQIDALKGRIQKTSDDMNVIVQKVLEIDLDALTKSEAELNETKILFSNELSKVSYEKSQTDSIKRTILSKESEGKVLANKYNSLKTKKQLASNVKSNLTYVRLMSSIKTPQDVEKTPSFLKLKAKAADLVAFMQNPVKICPSCGSEVKNGNTEHASNDLEGVLSDIQELYDSAVESNEKINSEISNLEVQSKKDEETIDAEMSDTLTQLQLISEYLDQNKIPSVEELASKENELSTNIKRIDALLSKIQQTRIEHAQLNNQNQSLYAQLQNYTQQREAYEQQLIKLGKPDISQDEAKLDSLERELWNVTVQLQELRQLLEVSTRYAQQLETLKDGFKEIKSYVFINALNELNFRANKYLNDLFDVEATIKFTSEDQKIESKIVLNGQERSLGLLSGGQSRRFNLAVDLALADIVSYRKTSKLDLIIFDEYFKDLSEISMEKSLDLLKSRKSPVILIEHNSIFKNIVDNVFFVKYENGTSAQSPV